MDPYRPGFKTTEGWLSALAFACSCLVAVKAVPVNVSTVVQADAVKALPVIAVGYAIARSIAKVGWKATVPLVESELGLPVASSTTTVTFPTAPATTAPDPAPPEPPAPPTEPPAGPTSDGTDTGDVPPLVTP